MASKSYENNVFILGCGIIAKKDLKVAVNFFIHSSQEYLS